MAGKSPKKKYGEFRIFAEKVRHGKYRIRPEFVPSLAAYLLMCGKVYQRAIDGMQRRILTDQVPGMEEACKTLEMCQQHLQRLMNGLDTHFDADDWLAAVAVICDLMNIHPETLPPKDNQYADFSHAITELPEHGNHSRPK